MIIPEYLELWKRRSFDFAVTGEFEGEIRKHYKQEEVLKCLTDETSFIVGFGGAKAGAKSFAGAIWQTFMCLQYEDVKYFVARDEHKKLIDYTLQTFYKVFSTFGLEHEKDWQYNGQYSFIRFPKTNSIIKFIELKYNPSDVMYQRHGGGEFTGGWLEEAGEIHEAGFNYAKLNIGRWNNDKYNLKKKCLITLNPNKNWCHGLLWKPYKTGQLPLDTKFIPSLVTDNPFVPADYVKSLEEITDTVQRQRLFLGNFDYDDDDDSLIPFEKIQDLFTNSFIEKTGDMFISADIAIGNDYFVLCVWDGMVVVDIFCEKNMTKTLIERTENGRVVKTVDYSPLINKFEEYSKKYKVPKSSIIYDADGLGYDMTKYLAGSVGINNNRSALGTDEYGNLKSQLYYKFVELVKTDKIWIEAEITPDLKERIISECQHIKSGVLVGEKLKVMPKAEVKKSLGHSPDITDGLIYRMLFWLSRKK